MPGEDIVWALTECCFDFFSTMEERQSINNHHNFNKSSKIGTKQKCSPISVLITPTPLKSKWEILLVLKKRMANFRLWYFLKKNCAVHFCHNSGNSCTWPWVSSSASTRHEPPPLVPPASLCYWKNMNGSRRAPLMSSFLFVCLVVKKSDVTCSKFSCSFGAHWMESPFSQPFKTYSSPLLSGWSLGRECIGLSALCSSSPLV